MMSNDQKRKTTKQNEVLSKQRQATVRETKFIDALDKYSDEFDRAVAKPPVLGVFGIFEIEDIGPRRKPRECEALPLRLPLRLILRSKPTRSPNNPDSHNNWYGNHRQAKLRDKTTKPDSRRHLNGERSFESL